MPKKARPASPPSSDARDNLFAELRQTTGPITAKDLAKRLTEPHQLRPADVATILENAAAAHEIHAYSAKTVKGARRFWDRDANVIARSAIQATMQAAEWPLTAKEIAATFPTPLKSTDKEIEPLLREFVASRALYEIPKKTAKGQLRYWQHDVLELGRRAVLSALAKGPQTKSALQRAVKGFETQFDQIFQSLLDARTIWRHPASGKAKADSYGLQPPSPGAYLQEVGKQLSKVVERLRSAHVTDDDLRRAIVQLAEAAGVSLSPSRASGAVGREPKADDLVALMKQIKPGAEVGAMVTARELRRAAQMDKASFDRSIVDLARHGHVMLHRHDHASHLSTEERDELIADGQGNHFVGVALRRSDG